MCCSTLAVSFDEGFRVQLNASSLLLMPELYLELPGHGYLRRWIHTGSRSIHGGYYISEPPF